MPSLPKPLKQLLKTCDLFCQPATFRYGDQPSYRSLTGGICSVIMIMGFLAIIITTVLSTFNRRIISYKTTVSQQEDPTFYGVGADTFIFAVGISGINLNQGEKWFQIYFQKREYQSTDRKKISVPLQPCQRSQWTRIKQELGKTYDSLGFDGWLCPSDNLQIELQGKYSSEMFKHYKIGVKQCRTVVNQTRNCVSNQTIQKFLNANQTFTFNFYYVNSIINPGNQNFTQNYLDDLNYFPFTPYDGASANFFISGYEIETDQSLYPYEMLTYKRGGVSSTSTQTINYKVRQADYLKFYIRKSSLSMKIHRQFRKIDDSLSYVGGLFSTMLSLLILVSKFNSYSYEMEIAKNLYHYEKNQPLRSDQFNFLVFMGYMVYNLFKKININLNWKKMEIYHRSLLEVRKQMDIRLVMKKILYSERMAIAVFDEPKAKILHLQEPLTLQQAEEIRKDHRFYQKLQQKFFNYKKIKQEQKTQNSTQESSTPSHHIDQNNIKLIHFQQPTPKLSQVTQNYNRFPPIRRLRRKKTLRQLYQAQKKQQKLKNIAKNKNQGPRKLPKDQELQEYEQQQLNEQIDKMKHYANLLLSQAQSGDKVSEKILSRFDPKLMKLILIKQQKMSIKSLGDTISANKYYDPQIIEENLQQSSTQFVQKSKQKQNIEAINYVSPLTWSLPLS